MIRVFRRSPVVWGFLGLASMGALYATGFKLSLIHISEPTRPY